MNLIGRCTAEGVKLVRYADDIVVFAKSKRAAERLLESGRKYLEGRLKLKMKGAIEATVKNIVSLMRSLNLTLDNALDTLGVPEDIRSEVSKRVIAVLKNE